MSRRSRHNEAQSPGHGKLGDMKMPTTWASAAAAALLAQRSSQVTWMRTPYFLDYLKDYLAHNDAGQFITQEEDRKSLARGLTAQWESGERYVLSIPAAAALFSAASTLGEEVLPPILPDDLPSESGLVLFPRTVYGTSMRGEKVGVTAFSWGPCYAAPGVPGTFLTTWTHRDAEDDSRLRALRTARSAMKQMAEQMVEEADYLARTIEGDSDTPEDERAALHELVRRRKREAIATKEKAEQPRYDGEFELLDMQPIPFLHEYRVKPGSEHQLREEKTTPLDSVDPDSSTLVSRLPFALWGLVKQGLLPLSPVPLTPRVEKKYGKKRLPHHVTAVEVPEGMSADDLITASRVRVVREDGISVRDGFQWGLSSAIGGRVR